METVLLVAIAVLALLYFLFFRNRPTAEGKGSTAAGASKALRDERRARPGTLPIQPGQRRSHAPGREPDEVEALSERPDAGDILSPGAGPSAQEISTDARNKAVSDKRRPVDAAPPSRSADVQVLRRGLARSRESGGVFGKLKALFEGRREIDAGLAREIEEVLLSSDVGASTTQTILARIRDSLDRGELDSTDAVWKALRQEAVRMLDVNGQPHALGRGLEVRHRPAVVLFVGVNGAGKTTTIGKLATQLQAAGKKCVLAAGDTFRAAAVQQLVIWGKRVGCDVVHGKDGADPGSVLFEAIKKAEEVGADVVLADTAGRLHTKANLMSEMQKIARSAGKALSGAPHETFLVIDSTNGQNALAQAREFKDALNVSGIILTKLDGTAKGGVVLGICDSLRLPVRFVGMGEGPDDLHEFVPQRFVDALLGDEIAR
jgi:fused signal recognition particle receptor